MNLTGQVISVNMNMQAKKQDGGVYPAWQLIFSDRDGKVKDITKHINGLKYTPGLKEGLESLQPGDAFTAVIEKNGAYNEVKQIVKGEFTPVATPTSGKVTGSNYETPDEREWNRVRIVRQSTLAQAVNVLKTDKTVPNVDEVLALASKFEEFVNRKS